MPDARYADLDEQYAKGQNTLSKEIAEIETALCKFERSRKSADKYSALVEKYENFDTLTTIMLNFINVMFAERLRMNKH